MPTFIYTLSDFLRSKNGIVCLITSVIFIAILWLGSSETNSKTLTIDSSNPPQNDASHDSILSDKSPITQVDTKSSFELFNPHKPKRQEETTQHEPATAVEPVAKTLLPPPIPLPLPLHHEALIKEEHPTSLITSIESTNPPAPSLPPLEPGARIQCQLLTPASTLQDKSPINAVVTRSLYRDGVLIIPKGAQISGNIHSSAGNRIIFGTNWNLENSAGEIISLSAVARQKSHDVSHGSLGVPGFLKNQPQAEPTGKKILASLIKGAAALGKDTVRTNLGDFVPATGRNAIINGSSAAIDQLLEKPKNKATTQEPYLSVPTGTEFYLVVSSGKGERQIKTNDSPNIDRLLEQIMRKRIDR